MAQRSLCHSCFIPIALVVVELKVSINQTYALVIFPTDDHYSKVAVGNTVTVRANYLVMRNLFGIVMKFSELISVEKDNA